MVFTVLSHFQFYCHIWYVEAITLKHVIEWMDGGQPFSISFITADTHKKTGGELVIVQKAWKYNALTHAERLALRKATPKNEWRKNPNHYDNSTRNIRLENGEIRKVHLRLLRVFNGKTIL